MLVSSALVSSAFILLFVTGCLISLWSFTVVMKNRQLKFEIEVNGRFDELQASIMARHQQQALMRAQIKTLTRIVMHQEAETLPPEIQTPETPKEVVSSAQQNAKPADSAPSSGAVANMDYQKISQLISEGVDEAVIMRAFDVSRSELELLQTLVQKKVEQKQTDIEIA